MNRKQMKLLGVISLAICLVCTFIAVERYYNNANNVKAANSFKLTTPIVDFKGNIDIEPGIPTATKYAAFFAVLSGVGGAILIVSGRSTKGDASE